MGLIRDRKEEDCNSGTYNKNGFEYVTNEHIPPMLIGRY